MSRHRALWLGACTVVLIVGVCMASVRSPGAVVLVGATVFVLGLAVLVRSTHGVRACRRWLRSMPTPSAAQVSTWSAALGYASPEYLAVEPGPELSDLTDEQLCDEWRRSYVALQRRLSPRQLMTIVHERQRYLDEFERRSPGGVNAWLASGAWASSTPLPYLDEHHSNDPAINWDQLMREQGW